VCEVKDFYFFISEKSTRLDFSTKTCPMNRNFSLFILFNICFLTNLLGQLSGNYVVGGATNDYLTLQDAFDDIEIQGMNGNVHFLINDTINESLIASNFNFNDSIFVEPITGNYSDSIRLNYLEINNSKKLVFSKLKIEEISPTNQILINIQNVEEVIFENCVINDSTPFPSNSFPTIRISVGNQLNNFSTSVLFKQCTIIESNDLSNLHNAIEVFGVGEVIFQNDSIIGSWETGTLQNIKILNSYVFIQSNSDLNFSVIDSSVVQFDSFHTINCPIIKNSIFPDVFSISLNSSQIVNCVIYPIINFFMQTPTLIEGNEFRGRTMFTNSQNLTFNKNKFFKGCDLIWLTNIKFVNNFFFDTLYLNGCTGFAYHNNFGEQSRLEFWSSPGLTFSNNNIYNMWGDPGENDLVRNNYFTSNNESYQLSLTDPYATYYNPNYLDSFDLHISNPAIFSSANYMSSALLNFDIDNDQRLDDRSMGADEVCIGNPLPDTIAVFCGSIYKIKKCNDISSTTTWFPTSLFYDTTSVNWSIKVDTIKTVYMIDLFGQILDSIVFIPIDYSEGASFDLDVTCGIGFQIATYQPEGSSIIWIPSDVVADSASNSTYAFVDSSMVIYSIVDVGSCGLIQDTFNINVIGDYFSYPYVQNISCGNYLFWNNSSCIDSLLWDFGDSSTSNMNSIEHNYANDGVYTVNFTMWNDTIVYHNEFDITVDCFNTGASLESLNNDYGVYPNPFNNEIFFPVSMNSKSVSIMSQDGKIVAERKIEGNKIGNLESLELGVYFLEFYLDNSKVVLKILKYN
jgi:hypothetical protein